MNGRNSQKFIKKTSKKIYEKFQKRPFLRLSWAFFVHIFFFNFLFFPVPVSAKAGTDQRMEKVFRFEANITEVISNPLPEAENNKLNRQSFHLITAYNSEVAQCDDSPCITANGFDVCKHGVEDTVAANFLPLGTKVRIPDLFGDRIFVVRDRMNRRYSNRMDVWMKDKSVAKKFGINYTKIEILD